MLAARSLFGDLVFFAVFAEVEMEEVPDGQWAPEVSQSAIHLKFLVL